MINNIVETLVLIVLVVLFIWLFVWSLITVGTFFKLPWQVIVALLVLVGPIKIKK